MARATAQRTKYAGLYKFETKRGTVYRFQVRIDGQQKWIKAPLGSKLEEARRQQLQAQNEVAFGGNAFAMEPRTFEDFARNDYLPSVEARVMRGELARSSAENIRRDLEGKLLPAFGSRRLDRISVEDIERFQDELSLTLAPWTVLRIINALSGALDVARRRKMIRENPCRDVEKVKAHAARTPHALTRADVLRLASAAVEVASVDEKNLILVAAFTGGRRGELHGLRWPNVDLGEGHESILIAEQVYRGEHKERTKTPSGFRLIALSPEASEALRSQQVEGRSSGLGLVFPAPRGEAWAESNFHRRRWQPIREAAGLPDLHFHDLRHFYVTYVRTTLGLATSLTEQLAGHSDERTHQHYTRPTAEGDAIIRAAMRRAHEEAQGR